MKFYSLDQNKSNINIEFGIRLRIDVAINLETFSSHLPGIR